MTNQSTQSAVVVQGPGVAKLVNRSIPKLRDDYILVKTIAVGLNPTDWKHIDFIKDEGPLVGCDYAGVVEAVGPAVKKSFSKGDRVCGFTHGCNVLQDEDGAFAEYIVAKGDLQIKIPDNISLEDAATLGVGITTIGQSLYQSLALPIPSKVVEPNPTNTILVYGGSTATGILAIQFAKLSGCTVLTTCSPGNFELMTAIGADAVFNYRDADCAEKIRLYTDDKLNLVLDTISLPESVKICSDALSSSSSSTPLRYHALLPVEVFRSDVKVTVSAAYSAVGEPFVLGDTKMDASEEDYVFAVKFWNVAQDLVGSGKVKPAPALVRNGLDGVLEGLQDLRDNKVSGKKLVYRL